MYLYNNLIMYAGCRLNISNLAVQSFLTVDAYASTIEHCTIHLYSRQSIMLMLSYYPIVLNRTLALISAKALIVSNGMSLGA